MHNYILVIISTVLLAVDFALQKLYQQKCGTGVKESLTFNAVVGLTTAIIFLFINGFKMQLSLYPIIMALCMSTCLLSYASVDWSSKSTGYGVVSDCIRRMHYILNDCRYDLL